MAGTATLANLLGDPTRVRILDALTDGPMRTAELAAATGMTPAALSRHLNQLRKAEVVARMDVAEDGRGRAYQLRPAALDPLAGWLHCTSWAAALAGGCDQPPARRLLARVGGFLDAFAAGDVASFERHLRADAVLVFPGLSDLVDKSGAVESVAGHPPYRRHRILAEPIVRRLGVTSSLITITAEVATAADQTARSMFITAVIDEGDPWQLAHLQWTPAAPLHQKGTANG